jgi:hypothetical protein
LKKSILILITILLISYNQTLTEDKNNLPEFWDTAGKKVFVFDPKLYLWAVYNEQGKKIKSGDASGGKEYCPDLKESCRTVTGTFQVITKKDADYKSTQFPIRKEGKSSGGASMPYSMHFHKGYAIHGAKQVTHKHVSHGCIHVSLDHAKWLNNEFIEIGTQIIVRPYA